MAKKKTDILLDFGLPLMIILLMAGMGATIVPYQIRDALKNPRALLCGMTSQFVLMPLIGYMLYKVLGLTDAQAIGVIIVACTPGGTTSNLFAFWSKGDVALSICMTCCSTLCALFMLPLLIQLLTSGMMDNLNDSKAIDCAFRLLKNETYSASGINQYCYDSQIGTADENSCHKMWLTCNEPAIIGGGDAKYNGTQACLLATQCFMEIKVESKNIALYLMVMLVPVAGGIWARTCTQRKWLADTIVSTGNNMGILVIIVLLVTTPLNYPWLFTESPWEIWLSAFFIGNLGFFFGYQLAWASRLSIRHCRTVSLETGIQNGPLAITIVTQALPFCTTEEFGTPACLQSQVLTFPVLYSIFIVLQSVGVSVGIYQRFRPEPPVELPKQLSHAMQGETVVKDENSADKADAGTEKGDTGNGNMVKVKVAVAVDAADTGALPRRNESHLNDMPGTIPVMEIPGVKKQGAGFSLPEGVQEAETLWQNFKNAALLFPTRKYLGSRTLKGGKPKGPYKWQTYSEAYDQALAAASGLVDLGVPRGGKVALFAKNRAEWLVTASACDAMSLMTVPLYDTLGPDAIKYILSQTKATICFCGKESVNTIAKLKAECPDLTHIVKYPEMFKTDPNPDTAVATVNGVTVVPWAALLAQGTTAGHAPTPPSADDVALVCYTSGTTGVPKGAMLSHKNVLASAAGAMRTLAQAGITIDAGDIHISYLPLAHIFERTVTAAMVTYGGGIGFSGGDIRFLTADMIELKPTIFCSVPRLLNRVADKILEAVNRQKGWGCWGRDNPSKYNQGDKCGKFCSRVKWPPPALGKIMFHKGYEAKMKGLQENLLENGFWDSSVFQAVSSRLGGRVRAIITGSAPISSDVLNFLRICFRCPVMEGYGQTECGAACTITHPFDLSVGHVGAPISCNEIRLDPIPEMSYLPSDRATVDPETGELAFGSSSSIDESKGLPTKAYPRGEICIRGPNVFQGYYNNPEETEKVLVDGWLHTGDVGMWLPTGQLKVIDRKKNIFKLSQGEYIAPEKIENIYKLSKFVDQVFVYGDSLQHQLVAIVVPDFESAQPWLDENIPDHNTKPDVPGAPGQVTPTGSRLAIAQEALCQSNKLRREILADLRRLGKESSLHGFEQIKTLHLEFEPFTPEKGLITATFKSKRPALRDYYKDTTDRLYAELSEGQTTVLGGAI